MSDGHCRWDSPVRRRLRESQPVFGVHHHDHAASTSRRGRRPPASTSCGWRWSIRRSRSRRVRNIVLATRGLPAVPFARVPVNETVDGEARARCRACTASIFPFVSTPPSRAWPRPRAAILRRDGADRARASRPRAGRIPTRLLRLGRPQHHDGRRRRGSVRRSTTSTRLRPRPASTSSSSAPAICRFRSGCAASSSTRGSKRRRPPSSPPRGGTARLPDAPRDPPRRRRRYIDEGFLFLQAPSDLALFETGARAFLGAHGIQPARRQRTPY